MNSEYQTPPIQTLRHVYLFDLYWISEVNNTTVLPAKSDSDVMSSSQSYQGLIFDSQLVY